MTTHTGTIYDERHPNHIDHGIDCTAHVCPSGKVGYAVHFDPTAPAEYRPYSVLFVAIRGNGRMEWLSFCDRAPSFETEADAIEYASHTAATSRHPSAIA